MFSFPVWDSRTRFRSRKTTAGPPRRPRPNEPLLPGGDPRAPHSSFLGKMPRRNKIIASLLLFSVVFWTFHHFIAGPDVNENASSVLESSNVLKESREGSNVLEESMEDSNVLKEPQGLVYSEYTNGSDQHSVRPDKKLEEARPEKELVFSDYTNGSDHNLGWPYKKLEEATQGKELTGSELGQAVTNETELRVSDLDQAVTTETIIENDEKDSLLESEVKEENEKMRAQQSSNTTNSGKEENEMRAEQSSNKTNSELKGNESRRVQVQSSRSVKPGEHRKAINDARVRGMRDQLLRAKVYLELDLIKDHARITRELQEQIKDVESTIVGVSQDSELQKGAYGKLKTLEGTMSRAKQMLDDCVPFERRLRASIRATEGQLRSETKQTDYLTQLAAKTLPRGLHCLALRLSIEYYSLNSTARNKFRSVEKLEDPKLYHYALFSDNVLAAAVVVNSTLCNAKNPGNHVFHIVTDKLNYAAMRMWFLANPPAEAAIQVQRFDEFKWLNASYSPVLRQIRSRYMIDYYFRTHSAKPDGNLKYRNPKYLSILNHLRFYLSDIFPKLQKVVFLDDDVVVQKDLSDLWDIDLRGKVNGAVETCGKTFHRFDRYLNFSNPLIAKKFDPNACGWAYGMNVFDLVEWRKQNITQVYHSWQERNSDRLLWKLGSLPPGLITFYNSTLPLNRTWHVLGLGYDKNVKKEDIERAAVIHFNGNMKPWLEIGMAKFRSYWTKYLDYDQVYIRDCNIVS